MAQLTDVSLVRNKPQAERSQYTPAAFPRDLAVREACQPVSAFVVSSHGQWIPETRMHRQ